MTTRPTSPLRLAAALLCLALGPALAWAQADLRINEAMASNTRTIYDEDGDYEDWIEIYNAGDEAVNLSGYALSDDPTDPMAWIFPSRMLAPGGYRLVWASGKDRDNYLHTSFKLDSGGDLLLLSSPAGVLLDAIATDAMPADVSQGRAPDGAVNWLYFAEETHAEPNPELGYAGFAAALAADQPPGFQSGPLAVTLSSPTPGAVIRYTLDGAEPDSLSAPALGAIPVAANTVLRARGFEPDLLPGPILTLSYYFGEERDLPLLSLVTDPFHLWDEHLGIYVLGTGYNPDYPYYGANFWESWERPAHLEFFEPDGTLAFAQDMGIRIHGGYTRALPQKSLRLIARPGYGAGKFDYPVFPGHPVTEFKFLVLRNAGNDWCRAHCRDALLQSVAAPAGLDQQAYRPAVLFINGEYWGIQNLRERLDPEYVESHHGLGESEIDLIKEYDFIMAGDDLHYAAMLDFIDGADLTDPLQFELLQGLMDTDDYLAYCVHEIFFANYDWPGGNIKHWRPRSPSGRWRWMLYDLDYALGLHHDVSIDALANALDPAGGGWPNPPHSTYLLRRLMDNPDFRRDFINHYCELLSSRFRPEALHAAIDATGGAIASEMPAHMVRWDFTHAVWLNEISALHDYADARGAYAWTHLQAQFALGDSLRLDLAVDPPAGGRVVLTAVEVDSAWSGLYLAGNPIALRAAAAPGWAFTGWSGQPLPPDEEILVSPAFDLALTAHFAELPPSAADAVINEIHYHSAPSHESGDWVEFHNPGAEVLDLTGWFFRDEDDLHEYRFPAGSSLPAGGYAVLCEDALAFAAHFPGVTTLPGESGFGFSGGGELLRLFNAAGDLHDSVLYDDQPPWPPEADGLGPSLELIHPERDNSLPLNWAAAGGDSPFGSPGARNSRFDATAAAEVPPAALPLLEAPRPNPFNPSCKMRFYLPSNMSITLSIYDVAGREIECLAKGAMPGGWHEREWRATGRASGVYLALLRADGHRRPQKLLLLK